MTFIDYEKAFDSVPTTAVLLALREHGVDRPYIALFKYIYNGWNRTLQLHQTTCKFLIQKGVRQGDTISPPLFTACPENVFRNIRWRKTGVRNNGEYLSHLRFSGDIILFSQRSRNFQRMLCQLCSENMTAGLEINTNKSKVMPNRHSITQDFKLG